MVGLLHIDCWMPVSGLREPQRQSRRIRKESNHRFSSWWLNTWYGVIPVCWLGFPLLVLGCGLSTSARWEGGPQHSLLWTYCLGLSWRWWCMWSVSTFYSYGWLTLFWSGTGSPDVWYLNRFNLELLWVDHRLLTKTRYGLSGWNRFMHPVPFLYIHL